ncbi:aspartyl-phosphate phosphatase Spo0E family protein [Wukongibacter baidiensis]|uniref:aspartyl-phosphate phosphatase Spo0E family protein n=1 Tax=Wukongibacter baidiensis TaxID=1723361 RepID=UPI003D7FBD4C
MGTKVNLLEETRRNLECLIEACNGNLLDPFVIAASQKLDTILNEYNEFIIQ